MAPGEAPAERTLLADEVLLADELVEVPGAHPSRERLAFGRGLEQRLGSGAGRATGWHAASLGGHVLAPGADALPRSSARARSDAGTLVMLARLTNLGGYCGQMVTGCDGPHPILARRRNAAIS